MMYVPDVLLTFVDDVVDAQKLRSVVSLLIRYYLRSPPLLLTTVPMNTTTA